MRSAVADAKRFGVIVLLTASLGGCQVASDPYGRTIVSTPTLGQALGLSPQVGSRAAYVTSASAAGTVQDQRVVAGRTVQIVRSPSGFQILVDGRVLANDNADDRVVMQDVYGRGNQTYVLVAEQSGGSACPSLYQVLDLSGSMPVISPQIGNCSDIPRVSVVNGAFHMSVPAFRAAPAATYTFRDGRLMR